MRKIQLGRLRLSDEQIKEYARRVVELFLKHWHKYAYVDNPECAEFRLYKFEYFMPELAKVCPTHRRMILEYVAKELLEKGYRIMLWTRKNTKKRFLRLGDNTVLVVCKSGTT